MLICSDGYALSNGEIRHFLSRTGFSLEAGKPLSPQTLTREQLVHDTVCSDPAVVPPLVLTPAEYILNPNESQQEKRLRRQAGWRIRAWWVSSLLNSRTPIHEKMHLFWNDLFSVSFRKVKNPQLYYQFQSQLKALAMTDLKQILTMAINSPAVLLNLDAGEKHFYGNNENLAREFLELYTVGDGHFSEQDVRTLTELFTAWRIDIYTARFSKQPVNRQAVFFDRTITLNDRNIVEAILSHPQTSRLLIKRLWRYFVSPEPDPVLVEKLSREFRESGFQIKPLLESMFLTDTFWDTGNRATLIKSPVELLIGTIQSLDTLVPSLVSVARLLRELGQDLIVPPGVNGWPENSRWITSGSLARRQKMLRKAADEWSARNPLSSTRKADIESWAERLLLLEPAVRPDADKSSGLGEVLLDPVYQLK
ncbi:MAG: DUF1800 family protein [Gammaproteobacteria bacterium]|nr:DUF1800 family protein [Gammaproteobacteria bacterium]